MCVFYHLYEIPMRSGRMGENRGSYEKYGYKYFVKGLSNSKFKLNQFLDIFVYYYVPEILEKRA